MHEFSFCQGIITAVETEFKQYKDNATRVTSVYVVIGRLHQVVEDNLRMAFEVLSKETAAEKAEFHIRFINIEYSCKACSHTGTVDPPLFLCGKCSSGKLEIIKGKELYLEKMELE